MIRSRASIFMGILDASDGWRKGMRANRSNVPVGTLKKAQNGSA
jgi:hypothetical protein